MPQILRKLIERLRARVRGQTQGLRYYYCDMVNSHRNREVVQVSTFQENPICPICHRTMTFGRYW